MCTIYYLYIAPEKSTSVETRRSQQKFFMGIFLQTSIPLGILLFLVLVGCLDGITREVTQGMTNFMFLLCATHGIVASVAVLVVHRSYREAVWKLIRKKRDQNSFSSIFESKMLSLEEYYATNYSRCNLTYSFLASWQGLAYPSHATQVIALPIQIFTFYIIWKYTPMAMKGMKWPILINLFSYSLLEFLFCTMSTPYVFFRNMAFLGVGLFHLMGVSNRFQLIFGFIVSLITLSSYLYVFECRNHLLVMNRFKIVKKRHRIMYHSLIYVFNISLLYPLLTSSTKGNDGKLDSLKIEPCPTKEFFENDIFVVFTDVEAFHILIWVLIPILLTNVVVNFLFHITCTIYYLYIAPEKSTSSETRRNQQKFFVGIILQTSIPTGILLFFVVAFCFDGLTHNLTQGMTNFVVILAATHGIAASCAVLAVHRSYRDAVWKLIRKMRDQKFTTFESFETCNSPYSENLQPINFNVNLSFHPLLLFFLSTKLRSSCPSRHNTHLFLLPLVFFFAHYMPSKIEEYYATNYSKCNLTYSFLASWQGLAYTAHSIQVIALPLQIFTFYVMMRNTPTEMKPMKWPLLINHFCCCLFDFILCTMSTPYFFFQNTGFLGVGLFNYLGISHFIQLAVGIPLCLLMTGSYIYMFESRSNILPMNRFRIKSTSKRVIYHLFIYLVSSTLLTLLLRIPHDQEAAKLESLMIEPCPTREFFISDVLIVMPDIHAIRFTLFIHGPLLSIHVGLHVIFHVSCTVYCLYISSANSISPETRKNQKKFFIAIIFQTIIPLSFLLVILVILISTGIRETVTQEVMNLTIIIFAMHGISESITVLLVHGSYRKAVWRMMMLRGYVNKVSNKRSGQ
ncbi:hypothetical protein CAEBREN_22718 [Caenorhabditis brenneri]|uniref:Serpentine Receptor, class H n=1 Tax=Caenorhabditis brenneri TaxID=135651 RepID=G0NSX1_CAEBE|nr:hypothetical protein CAEBREN_22718 [Caenorhabditis brenneri]